MMAYHLGAAVLGVELAWFDRSGKEVVGRLARDTYRDPVVSPDGKKLAISLGDPLRQIWTIDLATGAKSRLTFDSVVHIDPVWSPDGKYVAYTNGLGGVAGGSLASIHWKRADGSAPDEALVESRDVAYAQPTFSPDGKYAAFIRATGPTGNAVYAIALEGERKPFQVIASATPQNIIAGPAISPDGKWLAYDSSESGTSQVYVTSFPGGTGKWQVSVNGGVGATWRRDSRELYFFSTDGSIYAVPVSTAGTQFNPGQPQALFRPSSIVTSGRTYYPAPDGQRFLVPTPAVDIAAPIQLLLNWPAELESKK
jgi:serine/threonine-protein kinase